MQIPAALEILSRGYKLILTDQNPECSCSALADEFIIADTFDIRSHLHVAHSLRRTFDIRAVMTSGADCHATVAAVANALGLPGVTRKLSKACRHKHLTRTVLSRFGIPQPKFQLVRTFRDAIRFFGSIGGRGVLKSTDNSGSRGFTIVAEPDQLTEEAFEHALASGTTGYVLAEALLKPVADEIAEQSVETLWYSGQMYWLNWVDRLFRKDAQRFDVLRIKSRFPNTAWGIEIGHINPAVHSIETIQAVSRVMFQAGRAIGMHKQRGGHILKGDIMLTGDGPMIVELTPRLSGGWDSSGTTPARGANFIGGAVSLALGEKLTLDTWYRYFTYRFPTLFASILTNIPSNAIDCIGRRFSLGVGGTRETSLQTALKHLDEELYVLPMEQCSKSN